MKKYNSIILLLFILLSTSGCKDFFDVNNRTDALGEEDLELKLLLPDVEYYTAAIEFSKAFSMSQLQQHTASYYSGGVDQHYETSMGGAWKTYYTKVLYTIKKMNELATKKEAKHYLGVTQILNALSLGMLTDTYGDIPYSEAGAGHLNLNPALDSQQDLYSKIQTLLDQGIANITATDNSAFANIEGDIFYGGDLDKWGKLAYTLKARYALHLSKINGVTAAQDALAYLQNGFTSNSDDLQLFYNARFKNPWHTAVVLASNTGNLSILFSEQMVNYMNKSIYPTAAIDPRLPDYVDNGGAATYNGAVNGKKGKDVNGDTANTRFNGDSYYFKQNSPIVLVSYMEALFLKAEAEFLVNGGTPTSTGSTQAAYDAYKEGITASMNKMGIDSALRDAYLNDPAIDVNPANLKLENIMVQKYVALVLSTEIFTDLRRYDFSTNVYPGLAFPVNRNPDMPANDWPRRAIYPSGEVDTNSHITQVNFWDHLWWDQ